MLRNEEFRSIMIKLIIIQLIFAISGFILIDLFINNINQKIIERDIALFGNIMKDYPELKNDIIPYITKGASEADKVLGQEALEQYGYKFDIAKDQQPILKSIGVKTQIFVFVLIFSILIPLGLIIGKEYKKIYEKINKVSSAAEKVVEGDFSIYLNEEGEGDFNILNHQFNQMANRLGNSFDILKKEKTFLKNMISDISHQLKTPLSSLIMINDILLEDENMDIDMKNNFLEREKNQLNRMEWLIINLLKVARIEAGAIEFKTEEVLLKDPLDIAIATLEINLKDKDIQINGNLNSIFYGDVDWTGEALINIIKNSTEHGSKKIEIFLEETPLFSSIIIKDNGEGIDEKYIPHIFKRFYKISTEVKPDSIGIGLNLAKIIIETQNGTIAVKSKKDVGTKFIITFLKR